MWDATAIVSWRWSAPKAPAPALGFSPMSAGQLAELQCFLEQHRSVEYMWVDWACVPQYGPGCVVEVARSKSFYDSRARMMIVLPACGRWRAAQCSSRWGAAKAWAPAPTSAKQKAAALAASVLMLTLDKGQHVESGDFGRVLTLVESMARRGRQDRLQSWLSLEALLTMTLDTLWAASSADPADADKPGLRYYWTGDV